MSHSHNLNAMKARRSSHQAPLADITNNSQIAHEARVNSAAKRTNKGAQRNTITNYPRVEADPKRRAND